MSPTKSQKERASRDSDRQPSSGVRKVTWDDVNGLIRESSGLKPSDRVLDVGCGSGHLSFELAPHCAYLTGVDQSEDQIALASERAIEAGADNVSFQVGEAERLEFTDGTFDKIYCRSALHHFNVPVNALREMARVVKSPGHLVIADIVSSEDPAWREAHNKIERARDPSHVCMLSPSQIRAALAEVGLSVESVIQWETRQSFGDWMRRVDADRSTVDRTRRMLQEAAKKKTTDLDLTLRGRAFELTHRWMLCLALKLT